LFLGHFVALQSGFDADVRLMPGQKTNEIQLIEFDLNDTQGLQTQRFNVALPFSITCTDIEQKLIDPKGEIGIQNTLDWRTQIKIDDPEYGETIADVQLNKPFSYRGFRFFQASAITVGSARKMRLELSPENGGEPLNINLMRNGSASLPDGTKIDYEAFFPDFTLANGQADTRSPDYNNPAVKLNVTTPAGEKKNAYAFFNRLPDGIPVGAAVAGYKFRLADFEKVPLAHVLSIKYDPYHGAFIAWYFGGFGLIGALIFVFFLSHKRVWALIQKKDLGESYEVVLGGNTNRNHQGFEDKFKKIVERLETQT
jgi:cytochrome c biogenesis protein